MLYINVERVLVYHALIGTFIYILSPAVFIVMRRLSIVKWLPRFGVGTPLLQSSFCSTLYQGFPPPPNQLWFVGGGGNPIQRDTHTCPAQLSSSVPFDFIGPAQLFSRLETQNKSVSTSCQALYPLPIPSPRNI